MLLSSFAKILINAASSDGRRNTVQCVDSRMLPRRTYLFGRTRSKPSQGSVPTDLTLASDFSLCFHCKLDSNGVLRPPIETTRVAGHLVLARFDLFGLRV